MANSWKPLPLIIYGFAIHPLSASHKADLGGTGGNEAIGSNGGLPVVHEASSVEERNPYVVALEVGDEVYAFEQYKPETEADVLGVWYRGYVVCTPRHPHFEASSSSTPVAVEEPQVYIGIFPASHIHVRDELADAEGRLAEVYRRLNAGLDPYEPFQREHRTMETVREEDETQADGADMSARKSIRIRPRPETGHSLRSPIPVSQPVRPMSVRSTSPPPKPLPPRPSLKSGDDTASGATQPLIDEISSALREWHNLMFSYLSRRDYKLFLLVKDHVEALHLGRRQLLAQTLGAEESLTLRRDCVERLVRGNVAQSLDVIVRHPGWGGLVTVDVEGDIDMRSWVGAIRMYAMQVALAYIDVSPADNSFAGKVSALGGNLRTLALLDNNPKPTPNPNSASIRPAVKFFHVYLELHAFVASVCSPGETAELYFSLYNKPEARFVTEEFCAILNHNGVLAKESDGGRIGPIRTLFTDLGQHDVQESIYLVCRIVRNGVMKLASNLSTSGQRDGRRGSEVSALYDENATNLMSPPLEASGPYFRRPFGCAVLELSQLSKLFADKLDMSPSKEHALQIFVPANEDGFSTLHQSIIASKTREFEKSPRAEMLAVSIKIFHGDAPTIVRENPSLLQDAPITSRLGFPDVVFPGDVRNEIYIKLWSGDFFASSGSSGTIRIRRSVANLAGSMGTSSNVQVTVEVRARSGQTVENAISQGTGEPLITRFESMVFHRNTTPTYGELVKLLLPQDLMQQCHLFFTFRHRSSRERLGPIAKPTDPTEKPFAFAYLPLFPDSRAFIQDGSHTLVLYKAALGPIMPDIYFGAPAILPIGATIEALSIPPQMARSAIPIRDSLVIRSFLCSTKFTQNSVLLGLLNWEQLPDQEELSTVLSKFTFVGEVEIVKFLRDIFDSLFAILVSPINKTNSMDDLIFNALVTVLGIVQDRRFNNFQPVLDVYIATHFNCAAAASHMIRSMNRLLADPTGTDTATPLRNALRLWHYVFKFIVRARELQRVKEAQVGGGVTAESLEGIFKRELRAHLGEVNKVMATLNPQSIIGTQTFAIQHFNEILPDLAKIYSNVEIVSIVTSFANAIGSAKGKIVIWKLIMYMQIVKGFLFDSIQSRGLLIEAIVGWIKPHFGKYDEYSHIQPGDVETTKDNSMITWLETCRLCVGIVAVMLDRLQQSLIRPSTLADRKLHRQEQDNVEYLLSLFPRLLDTYLEFQSPAAARAIERTRSPATLVAAVPAVFPITYPFSLVASAPSPLRTTPQGTTLQTEKAAIFNPGLSETAVSWLVLVLSSPKKHLLNFLEASLEIEGQENFTALLSKAFRVGTSILNNDAFPASWLNVNILAHKVILKLAEPVSLIMTRHFIPEQKVAHEFNVALWRDAFHQLLKLLSSDQLVIEEFSPQKRRAVWRLAGDIRGEGAGILLKLWESIGWPESEVALNARTSVSGSINRHGGYQVMLNTLVGHVLDLCLSHHDQLRNNAVHILYSMMVAEYHLSENFTDIEHEVVNKLDALFMSNSRGDDISRAFFVGQLRHLFDTSDVDQRLRAHVSEFLDSVDLFLELLLSVRELPEGEEFQDDRVIATLRLMNFIRRIGRDEIYIKYVHELVNMHLQSQNYVEAALTLKLHSDLHEWNLNAFVDPMPELDLPRQSQFVRKETLCLLILDYLGKGKAWESAVEICKEVAYQHMQVTFNYHRLSELLLHQATLLEHIVNDQRYYSDYFRVAFYGNFPVALRNKQFIYRGYEWEKFGNFCERMLNKHPDAQLLKTMTEPQDEIKFGTAQYIQCTAVTPEPDRTSPIFTNPDVPVAVRTYYEHSSVNIFSCQRTYNRTVGPDQTTDFRDMWVEKCYFTTEESFPTVLRRSEVVEIQVDNISPIENALLDVESKCKELAMLETKYLALAQTGTPVSTNALSMSLNSAVDAPNNAGVPLYREAFFGPDFLARNPDKEELVLKLKQSINELVQLIDSCLKLHGALCPVEMIPFHETLHSFFRKNFYDEIQQLPVEGISDAVDNMPLSPTTGQPKMSLSHSRNDSSFDWQSSRRSLSTMAAPLPTATVVASSSSSRPTFVIPQLPFASAGEGLPNGNFSPSPSLHQRTGSDFSGANRSQTPLQRNLAHLTRFGMQSITSGPGERNSEGPVVASTGDSTSPSGSFVNVVPGPGSVSLSRTSAGPTPSTAQSVREIANSLSAAAKTRISRMGSFSWGRHG